MTYTQSIKSVSIAEALYYQACDAAEIDSVIAGLLAKLFAAKAAHRSAFGALSKHQGEWV